MTAPVCHECTDKDLGTLQAMDLSIKESSARAKDLAPPACASSPSSLFPNTMSLRQAVRDDGRLGVWITNARTALEELRPVHEPPLVIDPAVDEVWVIEGQLGGAVDDMVGGLDAEHEAVVLVADLVTPAAEAAAGVDVFGLEGGEELFEDAFALEGRGRVAVVEAAVVGADDFVGGAEHGGVDEALDAVCEEGGVVDGFHGGFGHFEHDGPVGTFFRGG